jgi:hypothetical protein
MLDDNNNSFGLRTWLGTVLWIASVLMIRIINIVSGNTDLGLGRCYLGMAGCFLFEKSYCLEHYCLSIALIIYLLQYMFVNFVSFPSIYLLL